MIHTCAATYNYIVKVFLFLYRFKGKLGGLVLQNMFFPPQFVWQKLGGLLSAQGKTPRSWNAVAVQYSYSAERCAAAPCTAPSIFIKDTGKEKKTNMGLS